MSCSIAARRASLAGDYEGAQAAYKKLLAASPDSIDAQTGLARPCASKPWHRPSRPPEAAIAEEDWDRAARELEKILAVDPRFSDAQAKSDFVAQHQRLAALYADGSRLYDLGQWEEAIGQFEKNPRSGQHLRSEVVAEFLFVSYLKGSGSDRRAGDDPATLAAGCPALLPCPGDSPSQSIGQ